jgi:RNA polymerase sigma factor (sigma-70 family)
MFVDETRSARRTAPLAALTSLRQDVRSGSLRLEDRILFEMVLEAIQQNLTDDQRHVVILRFMEGCSLVETASILGKELSHIKVIQTRAIAKLRKVFEARETKATLSLRRLEERSTALRI